MFKEPERVYFSRFIDGLESDVLIDGKPAAVDTFWLDFASLDPDAHRDACLARGRLAVFWAYGDSQETGVTREAPDFGLPLEPVPAEVRYIYRHGEGDYRLFGRLILPAFKVTGWGHSVSLFKERDPDSDVVVLHWESKGWAFKRGDEA